MRKGLLIIGSIVTGIGAIALWIALTWVVGYEVVYYPITRAVYPDPIFSVYSLIIIFIGLLLAIYGAIADPLPPKVPRDIHFNGLKILDERYARGEMTQEEYLIKKEDMKRV